MDNEARISALEEAMSSVKADLAVIRPNFATRADVQDVRAALREVRSGLNDFRSELRQAKIELQAEIQFGFDKLRAEFQKELRTLTWRLYGYGLVLVAAVHFLDKCGY